ncbi:hypothetical protein Tco_1215580 [Tanacetum coccineum]
MKLCLLLPEEEMFMLLICHPTMKKSMHVSLLKHPTILNGFGIRDYPTSAIRQNLIAGLPSLTFSKDKTCSAMRNGSTIEHHSKPRDHFPSTSAYISFIWICLDLLNLKPSTTTNIPLKMENINEVRVKELRSDNGIEFRNHKGISLDISYFYVFGCPMYIHNHIDQLGKFDAKADDGFFLGYSLMAKAFRDINSPDEHPEFIIAVDHHIPNEHDDSESVEDLGIAEDQVSIIYEPISEFEPSQTNISPSAKVFINPPVPQDRWSREKHIELVNILGEPQARSTLEVKSETLKLY